MDGKNVHSLVLQMALLVGVNVRGFLANLDPIFVARCDIACWDRENSGKLQCVRSCLESDWVKPGFCPTDQELKNKVLDRACVHACVNDTGCPGISKCCSHECGVTCKSPLFPKGSLSGEIPNTPENVTVDTKPEEEGTEDTSEAVTMIVRWEGIPDGKILYLLEERHHVGKDLIPERMSEWTLKRRTTKNRVFLKNVYKPGRWFQFRVTAVNENGSGEASAPSQPFFCAISPKAPVGPKNFTVGATSWGDGKLNVQLTWVAPESDLPIHRYMLTWSRLKNLTLIQHHVTLHPNITYYWLKDLEAKTGYFLQIQAISKFGRKRLSGETSSMFFNTADHKHVVKSSSTVRETPHVRNNSLANKIKYKKRIKNFVIEKLYFVRDQLAARISWTPVNDSGNSYLTWRHNDCRNRPPAWYIGKTNATYFEVYDLLTDCNYSFSVKSIREETLFIANTTLSTYGCERSTHSIILECPVGPSVNT